MIPTGSQIFAKVREEFGDSEISGGQVWTDTKLLPYLSLAHQFLVGELASVHSELLQRDNFFRLAANRNRISVNSLQPLLSLEEVTAIYARKPSVVTTIGSAVNNSGILDITVASTDEWATGDIADVIETGINEMNGQWAVTVVSGTVLRIIDVPTTAVVTSGTLMKGPEWPQDPIDKVINSSGWPERTLPLPIKWCRQREGILITPTSQEVELKMRVTISGSEFSAASESVRLDGTQPFFVSWIVARIAGPKGRPELTAHHSPIWQNELQRMKQESGKDLQLSQRFRSQPFRSRRRFHISF
jgi:hypothetical protein